MKALKRHSKYSLPFLPHSAGVKAKNKAFIGYIIQEVEILNSFDIKKFKSKTIKK
jgi:hypothetical protein